MKYSTNQEPLVISKEIIDRCLKYKNASDMIALYTFYYYTAKWQKTNQPKAVSSYVQKGLKISKERISKAKEILIKEKMIKDIQRRKDGKIAGHYIKVMFIWGKEAINNTELQQAGNATSGKLETNALSPNSINACEKTSFSHTDTKLEYQEPPEDTYKTKQKIYAQKGLKYTPPKKTLAQKKFIKAGDIVKKYKDMAMELHGLIITTLDGNNARIRKNITDIGRHIEYNYDDYLDWWFDKGGEKDEYYPNGCFTTWNAEKYLAFKKKKTKNKDWTDNPACEIK